MGLVDWIYPKKCLGCGQAGKYFCDKCVKTIDLSDEPASPNRGECFNNHLSLFCYRGLIREAVKQLKFKFLKDMETELALLIGRGLRLKLTQANTEEFQEFLKLKPRVQPLPLYWFRRNRRGFNQAEVIAKIAAKALKLKLTDCLIRIKLTTPQSRLPREERLKNVAGIFTVRQKRLPKAILLIDDVWTTGATMREAMQVLCQRGAKQIWGLTLAR